MRLKVTNRAGMCIGYVEARVGLQTSLGIITRVSGKSVRTRSGEVEIMSREYDGRMPTVRKSNIKASEFIAR